MYRTCLVPAALLLAFCFAGCQTIKDFPDKVKATVYPDVTEPDESKIVRIANFDDLPVPPNFTVVPDQSFVFEHGAFRNARQVYMGAVHLDIITKFFEAHLPANGWKLVSSYGSSRQMTWRFDKETDACTIVAKYVKDYTVLTVCVTYK
ncbi:MAG: hypothetical protein RDV41_01750 [Planctomycetota bacterium]|nr:hypothetical protein [Planctomycetota bacterium]